MTFFKVVNLIITLIIGCYKWVNSIGLKEPYQSQLEGNYKKINTFLSSIKDNKEKPTLIKNARRLENLGFILLFVWGVFNAVFKEAELMGFFAIGIAAMMLLGFSLNWVLNHKEVCKSPALILCVVFVVLSPFLFIAMEYSLDKDLFMVVYQPFMNVLSLDRIENQWVSASIISVLIISGLTFLYFLTWMFALPIAYGAYTVLWIFNRYLKITGKYTDNLISVILFALWLITLTLGYIPQNDE